MSASEIEAVSTLAHVPPALLSALDLIPLSLSSNVFQLTQQTSRATREHASAQHAKLFRHCWRVFREFREQAASEAAKSTSGSEIEALRGAVNRTVRTLNAECKASGDALLAAIGEHQPLSALPRNDRNGLVDVCFLSRLCNSLVELVDALACLAVLRAVASLSSASIRTVPSVERIIRHRAFVVLGRCIMASVAAGGACSRNTDDFGHVLPYGKAGRGKKYPPGTSPFGREEQPCVGELSRRSYERAIVSLSPSAWSLDSMLDKSSGDCCAAFSCLGHDSSMQTAQLLTVAAGLREAVETLVQTVCTPSFLTWLANILSQTICLLTSIECMESVLSAEITRVRYAFICLCLAPRAVEGAPVLTRHALNYYAEGLQSNDQSFSQIATPNQRQLWYRCIEVCVKLGDVFTLLQFRALKTTKSFNLANVEQSIIAEALRYFANGDYRSMADLRLKFESELEVNSLLFRLVRTIMDVME